MERFAPDATVVAALSAREPGRELFAEYLRYIVERTTREPELTRALIELRLEAARRPVLGGTPRQGYHDDVAFHATTGLPGGAFEIALLHYALDGLLLGASIRADVDPDRVVAAFVDRLIIWDDVPVAGHRPRPAVAVKAGSGQAVAP
jgi:hypothetical protein